MTGTALPAGVELFLAPNPSPLTGKGTNTYLVAGASGAVVIDPGAPDHAYLAAIAHAASAHGGLRAILITHGHPDHLDGATPLKQLTGAPISAWSRAEASQADRELKDGELIPLPGRRLVAIHTPGHRFDHLCFFLPDERVAFAGDLLAGEGTVVIAPPEGDLVAYLRSLRRLLGLELRQVLPGHGPRIDDPAAYIQGYIDHRLDRERQVLAALASGPATVDVLVRSIYAELDPALQGAASSTLLAHLYKLEAEQRVAHASDGAWRLSPG